MIDSRKLYRKATKDVTLSKYLARKENRKGDSQLKKEKFEDLPPVQRGDVEPQFQVKPLTFSFLSILIIYKYIFL